MKLEGIIEVVSLCGYPGYEFLVRTDGRGEMYLQAGYLEPDTVTGNPEWQVTRRWFLSPNMTRSEIVQTVFKCLMTSMEHRAREWFIYKGKPVFGPHFDVEALWGICDSGQCEKRKPQPSPERCQDGGKS